MRRSSPDSASERSPDSPDRHVHLTPRTASRDPRRHRFDAVVAAFVAACRAEVLSERTIEFYLEGLNAYRTFARSDDHDLTLADVDLDIGRAWLADFVERGRKPATVVDTSASSGEATRWQTNLTGGDVYYPDRAEEDAKLLTYTSEPLERAIRITGTPVVSLHLSSTSADGALHVYLEDVAPDGRVTYLTEGILRLVHGTSPAAALPYEHPGTPRSFLRADAEPRIPGVATRVEMPLYATSVRLEAGHRLRVAVAGHDASTFALYPDDVAPVLTVVHSPASPSFLELPVADE